MTQQNGNEQSQRQLAPGMGEQEQTQQPGQADRKAQKEPPQEAERSQDGALEQEPQKDLKNQRGQPFQPGQGLPEQKAQGDAGSSSEKR